MGTRAEAGREFWRGVLVAGGFTAIPRWTLDPVPGVAEHEAPIPDDLVAALRRLADELELPLQLGAAGRARQGARRAVRRARGRDRLRRRGGRPTAALPADDRTRSWRALLLDTHRVESDLLAHQDFPVDELRRELGLTGPSFETVFDPTGAGGDLAEDTVLRVGDLARTAAGSCCGCATAPTCSTRTAPPGSPATTSPRSR